MIKIFQIHKVYRTCAWEPLQGARQNYLCIWQIYIKDICQIYILYWYIWQIFFKYTKCISHVLGSRYRGQGSVRGPGQKSLCAHPLVWHVSLYCFFFVVNKMIGLHFVAENDFFCRKSLCPHLLVWQVLPTCSFLYFFLAVDSLIGHLIAHLPDQ